MHDAPKATLVAAQPTAKTTSTPASKATTSASSSANDPATMVKNALEAMANESYRGTIKGPQSSANFEFTPPDNYHSVIGGDEYILLGETEQYMKSQGKWSKLEQGWGGFVLLPVVMGSGYADKMTNVKVLPNETLNGFE